METRQKMIGSGKHHNAGSEAPDKAVGAFLGAAVGDALGWPCERPDRTLSADRAHAGLEFYRWRRRVGTRFMRFEETVEPGEYSDDTQLLICTARSLLRGADWLVCFTRRELPMWSIYERGGGASLKRAVAGWTSGRPPWLAKTEQSKSDYFNAGGNGVAMRIMPHVLRRASDESYLNTASEIVANGVCTHGHPRALVGALAYGYAVRQAIRTRGTLAYGALLQDLMDSSSAWAQEPEHTDHIAEWLRAAHVTTRGEYTRMWHMAVDELFHMIRLGSEAMRKGPLPIEEGYLREIGCFDRRINGAGTVSAAAAVFLASRAAAHPIHGLTQAAFASGTDTDTIASMTGALLGAIHGVEWISDLATHVQDSDYIVKLARMTAGGPDAPRPTPCSKDVGTAAITAFLRTLARTEPDSSISMPDGGRALVLKRESTPNKSGSLASAVWKLRTEDDQTIYVRRFFRVPATGSMHSAVPDEAAPRTVLQSGDISIGARLRVQDLSSTARFYEHLLELPARRLSDRHVVIGDVLLLEEETNWSPRMQRELFHSGMVMNLTFRVPEVEQYVMRATRAGARIDSESVLESGTRYYVCRDPDGNVFELWEAEPTSRVAEHPTRPRRQNASSS